MRESPIKSTMKWLEEIVIGLNLCPFAKRELDLDRIRITTTDTKSETIILDILKSELSLLKDNRNIETTLVVFSGAYSDFLEYNDFLRVADDLLDEQELIGVFQFASFHPAYQFADTRVDDVTNYTNRSPYPMIHILREESLDVAIANYGDTSQIPIRNMDLMNKLGTDHMQTLLSHCIKK